MTNPANLAEKQCAISGIGQSEIGRRLYRDPLELTPSPREHELHV